MELLVVWHPNHLEARPINAKKLAQLLDLLRTTANLSDVSNVLKSHSLHHSGTWKQLKDRILAALKAGELTEGALIRLLRDSEEFGKQHVFFYKTSKTFAMEVVNQAWLAKHLKSLGRADLLEEPDLLSVAGNRALGDARIEVDGTHAVLVLKSVELRRYYKLEDTYDENGGKYRFKRYIRIEQRAVDVLRVHSDGFAELRIHSHENDSDYSSDVTNAWHFFAPFVSRFKFDDLSISKAQQKLWSNRTALKGILKYSDSRLRDKTGTVLSAASRGQQDSLFDNENAAKSIDAFWNDDTVCDKSNMWWLKSEQPDGGPTRPIHIMISGAVNEFAVPGQCSKEDYEYVLAQIKKANR